MREKKWRDVKFLCFKQRLSAHNNGNLAHGGIIRENGRVKPGYFPWVAQLQALGLYDPALPLSHEARTIVQVKGKTGVRALRKLSI